jgi:hypothetical protein
MVTAKMNWEFWERGPVECSFDGCQPLLASWEKATHPSQIRLRAYLRQVVDALAPLPADVNLFLHLDVDVEKADRLLRHYDLENYLTPLVGSRALPPHRFVSVSARKFVGGGSRITCGRVKPSSEMRGGEWSSFSCNAGPALTRRPGRNACEMRSRRQGYGPFRLVRRKFGLRGEARRVVETGRICGSLPGIPWGLSSGSPIRASHSILTTTVSPSWNST